MGAVACAGNGFVARGQESRERGRPEGRGREGDRGRSEDRGDSDRRRSFDPAEMIKRMDGNNNGIIEPNEISGRSRSYVERAASKAGLDLNQPIPLDKMAAAMQAEQTSSGSASGSPGGSSSEPSGGSGSPGSPPSPGLTKIVGPTGPQGFGAKDTRPAAAGFDVPLSVDASMPADKRYDGRVIEYVANMLKEQDKNSDGYIDSVEWKLGRWSTPPEASDSNRDNRLSREELYVRITKRFNLPLPGEKAVSAIAPPSSQGSGSGGPPSSSGPSGDLDKVRGYAKSLVAQHDRNKNGNLDRDEWGELRSDQRAADVNGDGVITVDELAARLQAYSSGGPARPSSTSPSSASGRKQWWTGNAAGDKNLAPKKSYRFLSPVERLPKGLPDWFLRNDADGDGQIIMTEYTTSWTEQSAADFMRYDLDSDGLITPAECLAADKKK